VALGVGSDVRLWEGPVKPIGEAMIISDEHHLKTLFFPIGFRMIKGEV